MHKVPLLFYHPTKKLPDYNTRKISQHADILPTLIDYLQIPTNKLLPFGQSLLDSSLTGRAMYYLEGEATLLHQDYITKILPNQKVKIYQYQPHGFKPVKKEPANIKEKYSNELKAYLQYFNNGLIDNNLYFWIPSKISAK